MTRTAVFRDSLFLDHDPGYNHVESPDRLAVIYKELDRPEYDGIFLTPDFGPASETMLARNHSEDHIRRIKATAGQSFGMLDPDTCTSAQSYDAACLAAGAVIEGIRLLNAGDIDNGFALVRPPGHHAEGDKAMGFCLFNNVAVGARYALEELGLERVLIIDWDLHHGNGTQHSFYDTDRVLYFSSHQYPYYPGSGALLETGQGDGEGYTVNVPLHGGQNDEDFAGIINDILLPIGRQYEPQLILVSAGYDIYQGDPLGGMAVTATGFAYMTRALMGLAAEVCGGRILFCLEGGYNLQGLRDGVLAGLLEMAGRSRMTPEAVKRLADSRAPASLLAQVQNIANRYWKL